MLFILIDSQVGNFRKFDKTQTLENSAGKKINRDVINTWLCPCLPGLQLQLDTEREENLLLQEQLNKAEVGKNDFFLLK